MVTTPPPPSETGSEPKPDPEATPDAIQEDDDAAVEDTDHSVLPGLSIDDMVGQVAWSDHEVSLGRWKQGHLVRNIPIAWLSPVGRDPMTGLEQQLGIEAPQWPEGTFDAVICSQTCGVSHFLCA